LRTAAIQITTPISERLRTLESSLRILEELGDALRLKPDRDEWLLHLAGVYWQTALALFYLGRYSCARSENNGMKVLIDRVPAHMWTSGQEEEYRSNYHFLEGELARAG
jgi:hypothetical protein